MKNREIHLLITFNSNYIRPFRTMLCSLINNNPGESVRVWLLHSAIPPEELQALGDWCAARGAALTPLQVDRSAFRDAPVSWQYPQEMYYRLLAPRLLPDTLDRVLYLDPDILVINPLRPLWETDLKGNLFAAAAHTGKTELANYVNRVRLGSDHDYYNSGVLLMDLAAGRREIDPEGLFRYVAEHGKELILPDQDLLNLLYGKRVLPLDDGLWNYDARNYNDYLLRSGGVRDLRWVMEHTAILHFCGKAKPWKPRYVYRFGTLYLHYVQMTRRMFPECRL